MHLVVVMFKITPSEISDVLFEDLPDALASSGVSDLDDEEDPIPSIDKLIENNFDRTFNSLIGNVSGLETEFDEVGINDNLPEIESSIEPVADSLDRGESNLGLERSQVLEQPGLDKSSTVRLIVNEVDYEPSPITLKAVKRTPRPSFKTKAKSKDNPKKPKASCKKTAVDIVGIEELPVIDSNEPEAGGPNLDQDESDRVADPGEGTSIATRPIDEVILDKPGPSTRKVVKKRASPSLKTKAKPKENSKKQKKSGRPKKKVKISIREIEERARGWKKKPTHLSDTPYDRHEGKKTVYYDINSRLRPICLAQSTA